MKFIAQLLSRLFHPILLPFYGYQLLFHSGCFFTLISPSMIYFILITVVISTILLPLLAIVVWQFFNKKRLNLDEQHDRVVPYFVTIVGYLLGAFVLKFVSIYEIYSQILVVCSFVIVVIQLINIHWKISAHMAAIGGILGVFFGLSRWAMWNQFPISIALILLSGLLGSSRLLLDKHTPAQVYAGFALGFSFPFIYLELFFAN